jgi:anti-sigma-K factor RskA
MSHDIAFAELGALALGALDTVTSAEVEAHVRNCAICTKELAGFREALAELPSAPPGATFDSSRRADIRSRLVARAAADHAPASSAAPWRLIALAASLALVAFGFGYTRERAKRTEAERLYAERLAESRELRALLADKDSRIAAITGPSVQVMEMSSTGVNAPTARMFWDRATNRWTVFAHGLAQPKPGRAYELWLVTADKKIPAGVFKPSADGSAVFTATYALKPEELKAIAVTDEPETGVNAPTGSMVLLGSASGT